jgi:hypothetical protein
MSRDVCGSANTCGFRGYSRTGSETEELTETTSHLFEAP